LHQSHTNLMDINLDVLPTFDDRIIVESISTSNRNNTKDDDGFTTVTQKRKKRVLLKLNNHHVSQRITRVI
jgi:hypothetical protein